MAYSIYEIDYSQDVAKPSDVTSPDSYVQDVFHQTRPEVFDYDDQTHDENPYFKYREVDEDARGKELSDNKYHYKPQRWRDQKPYFLNRKTSIANVVGMYRLAHDPITAKIKTAKSINELLKETSNFSIQYGNRVVVRGNVYKEDKNKKTHLWEFSVRGFKKESNPNGHTVRLLLNKEDTKDTQEKDIRNYNIQMSCTCPFWQYWGPEYNANREEYLLGLPQGNLGADRGWNDPQRRHKICKHVWAAIQVFDKYVKEKGLNNYEEVEAILSYMDSLDDKFINMDWDNKKKEIKEYFLPDVDIIKRKLDTSEKIVLDNILKKYSKEKNELTRKKLREQLKKELRPMLSTKEVSFLVKLLKDLKSTLKLRKMASIDNILFLYMRGIRDGEI